MASALFGVEGLRVIETDTEAGGTLTVWVVTDHPGAGACPDCGTLSGRAHERHVLTGPRDLRRGQGQVRVTWCKRRWKCGKPGCARKTFTESLPAVPPRCRLTRRLRELVLDGAQDSYGGGGVAALGMPMRV